MIGLYEANDLSPMLEIRLGEKMYQVPPLSLARFMRLTACNWTALLTGILGSPAAGLSSSLSVEDAKDPAAFAKKLGASLVDFPHVPFAPLVAAVVPGLSESEWTEHGDAVVLLRLYHAFGKTHDWKLISDAIGFGKSQAKPTTEGTIAGALMLFCQRFPFYKPEDLLSMRVDYFFLIRNGVMPQKEEPESTDDIPEAVYVKAPDSPLWAALEEADRKAGVN